MPRHLRAWYVLVATLAAGLVATVPTCRREDPQGRPLWQVETVHDGDTVTCSDAESVPHKIRLVGIDSPEYGQPFGPEARSALSRKLAGGRVRVDGTAHDQHGRLLATLWIDDRNLNRELVAEGYAWVFGGFSPDPDLLAAESEARGARRGLWTDPHPLSPSDWRRAHPAHR
jgi:micrococcal nuclease